MPAQLPVWLLDVDGVLNAARPGWGSAPRRGQAVHGRVSYPISWAPELIRRLAALHHDRAVEFRWATTWADEVAQLERLFGLPGFAVAFAGLGTSPQVGAGAHKIDAALRVVEQEHRPLIWADDDAIPTRGRVAERLRAAGQPVLLIEPDPRRGLQPADLEAVTEFVTDPSAWGIG